MRKCAKVRPNVKFNYKLVKRGNHDNAIGFMVLFYPTFNNITVISKRSILLVEEIGGPEENHRAAASF